MAVTRPLIPLERLHFHETVNFPSLFTIEYSDLIVFIVCRQTSSPRVLSFSSRLFLVAAAVYSQQQTELLIHLLKKRAPINDISGVLYSVDPMCIFSSRIWTNISTRLAAHAPTKYQSNSTSGRGARALYRTMLPEISARRSLLEPSFRYLSPGREGEKCRPLDHTWQNPFVQSAR